MHLPPRPSPEWAYFLDVDGTLLEIVETSDAIHADDSLHRLLGDLAAATGGAVALVSGRSLADLERRFGRLKLPMAGQHGLERRCAKQRTHLETPLGGEELLSQWLLPVVSRHAGLSLEYKGQSVALHYRQAPRLAGYVHRLARHAISRFGGGMCLQKGKLVVEIRPCGTNKGTAIGAFMLEPPFFGRRPVFIGDDLTDEHGFAAMSKFGGIAVKVGLGKSSAAYRLPDVASVRTWLMAATR